MLYNQDWEIKIEVNPTAKLLLDAADLIERHGHTKKKLYDRDGSMCFLGAIYKASESRSLGYCPFTPDVAGAVSRYLGLADAGCPTDAVVDWNNAPERTKDEVVSAMRAAARALA